MVVVDVVVVGEVLVVGEVVVGEVVERATEDVGVELVAGGAVGCSVLALCSASTSFSRRSPTFSALATMFTSCLPATRVTPVTAISPPSTTPTAAQTSTFRAACVPPLAAAPSRRDPSMRDPPLPESLFTSAKGTAAVETGTPGWQSQCTPSWRPASTN